AHERAADVVPVADVGQTYAGQPAGALADGLQIGERLAWIRLLGEAVEDRDRCGGRERVEVLLPPSAIHDRVEVARKRPRRVGDRLAAGKVRPACVELDRARSELL